MQTAGRILAIILGLFVFVSAHAATRIDSNDLFNADVILNPTVLQLTCRFDETRFYISKLALIKTDDNRYDYGLSSGHGVLIEGLDFAKDCSAKDYNGQNYSLTGLYVPADISEGGEEDWALMRLKKIKDPAIIRFSLPSFGGTSADDFKQTIQKVTFAKARGLGVNSQMCSSLPADFVGLEAGNILAHNCRAVGGQSGSPIAVSLNNQPILVGLHLGTAFTLHSKYSGKAENLGFFRFIDSNMVSEINDVITRHFN